MPEVGKKYYRVSHAKGRVVQVTSVNDGWVNATVLHGPGALKKKGYCCKEKNFHWHPVPDDWDEKTNMEVCSISLRKDFLYQNGASAKVLEVAIGTDRCVYNFLEK
jgi:hypothetical protein